AKGKEFLVVIDNGENGKLSSLFLGGHYEDTYVKTADGWRIKTRRLFPPRSGPQPQAASSSAEAAASRPVATSTSAGDQVRRGDVPLSAGDQVEIRQLIARSAFALDT